MVGRFTGVGIDVGLPFALAVGVGADVSAGLAVGEDVDVAVGTVKTTPTTDRWVGLLVGLELAEPTAADGGATGGRSGEPMATGGRASGSGRKGD